MNTGDLLERWLTCENCLLIKQITATSVADLPRSSTKEICEEGQGEEISSAQAAGCSEHSPCCVWSFLFYKPSLSYVRAEQRSYGPFRVPALQPFGIGQLVDCKHSGEPQGLLEGPNYGLLRKNRQPLSYWSLPCLPAIPMPLWYQNMWEFQVTGDGIMPNLNIWIIDSSIKNPVFNITRVFSS